MALDSQKMEDSRKRPRNAAIILNWNGLGLLKEFLPQVVSSSDPLVTRVIVADNGSTDGSAQWVRGNYGERVEVMQFDRNYGFAEGYNRAIAAVGDYEYVSLINSDLATDAGWDRVMTAFMDSHPRVGAAQPKILSYRDPSKFEYAGAAGGYLDRNGYPYCRGRIFDVCEADEGQYDADVEVFWASGAALMVRREVYLAAGGLDPAFFAHMEEIDLCWRIQLAGYGIATVGAASVRHLGGGSLPAENPRKTYLNFRNNLLMLHKNLPDSCRRAFLLKRRLLDTLAWAKYAVTFDWGNAAAIVRAHRDFARMRKAYTRHPDRNLLPETAPGRVNILMKYYLGGCRRFSGLNL